MPEADDGKLQIGIEMLAGTTLDVTDAATQRLEERITALPEVEVLFRTVGESGGTGTNRASFARIFVQLKGKAERVRTTTQVGEEIHSFAAETPGAKVTAGVV